jgi:hypothetical protein
VVPCALTIAVQASAIERQESFKIFIVGFMRSKIDRFCSKQNNINNYLVYVGSVFEFFEQVLKIFLVGGIWRLFDGFCCVVYGFLKSPLAAYPRMSPTFVV